MTVNTEGEREIIELVKRRRDRSCKRFVTGLRILHAFNLVSLLALTVIDAIATVREWGANPIGAYVLLGITAVEAVVLVLSVLRSPQYVIIPGRLVRTVAVTLGVLGVLCVSGARVAYTVEKAACCAVIWAAFAIGYTFLGAKRKNNKRKKRK